MNSIALAIIIVSFVAVVGLSFGSIKIRGVGLGSAGVLFAGILFGHFGASIDPDINDFAREFGLVLFVFTIGLQLGPGIVQLWKQQGLLLNGMALSIVCFGLLLTLGMQFLFGFSVFETAGIFSGATTNTPSLGAAQQAAWSLPDAVPIGTDTMASAYAVAYPGGIIGIIASMIILRLVLGISISTEVADERTREMKKYEPIERRTIMVDNNRLAGFEFGKIPGLEETGVRISRIRRKGEAQVHAATVQTALHAGDAVQVVGTTSGLDRFQPLLGSQSNLDLMHAAGDAEFRRIVVTNPAVLNKSLRTLSLDQIYNATVTRIRRSGVEMTANGTSRFHFGDIAHVVGDKQALDRVAKLLGNSVKALDVTHFAPVFLGIALGVLLGMVPIQIPGVPFQFKLGLAGGPLIAAILFSLIGRVGKFVWYIPHSANLALREMGIILFLACAGLAAGETFFELAISARGALWMLSGLIVTTVPLLTVGFLSRVAAKTNYLTICGVVAGSMTDPPALAFANSLSDSPASTTAYAAVYPLAMMLRIIGAQLIVYALA